MTPMGSESVADAGVGRQRREPSDRARFQRHASAGRSLVASVYVDMFASVGVSLTADAYHDLGAMSDREVSELALRGAGLPFDQARRDALVRARLEG